MLKLINWYADTLKVIEDIIDFIYYLLCTKIVYYNYLCHKIGLFL